MGNIGLPISLALALSCMACYSNRAVFEPWKYAPSTPRSAWTPPASLQMKTVDLTPALPDEQEQLSLGESIDIALQNSPSTRLSWAQARSAAASWAQTQSADFPQISGTYNWQRARFLNVVASAVGTEIGYLSQWGPQLSMTYTIFDFGQSRATSDAARWSLYFADWTHNSNIQTLIQTIMDDYYNYLYQKELLRANEEDLFTAEVTLDSAEVGNRTGVNDYPDILQARTQMLQARITLLSQQQAVETAFAQLMADMGLPANLKVATQSLPNIVDVSDDLPSVDDLIMAALQQRPDLLAAEADLRSKNESVKEAQLEFLPTLDYDLDFGRTTYTGGNTDGYDFTSIVSISVPIFTGFNTLNGVRLARANEAQSRATLEQTYLQVIQDVTVAYSDVHIAKATLKEADEYLRAAEEEYQVNLSEYRAGTIEIVNVISAQSSLADARAKKANAIQGWYTSLASLAFATGTLSPNSLNQEEL